MNVRHQFRNTLLIGLGLLPAPAVLAQEGDQGDRPQAERRQGQEARRAQRGRPDAEEMRKRLEEAFGRQLEDLPGRGRPYLIAPDGNVNIAPFGEFFFNQGAEDHGLGLTLRPVPEVLRSHLDLDEGRGLVVAEVAEGSPADGVIEPNDILLSLGDTPVGEQADLHEALQESEGETISITLLRKGEEQTVEVNRPRPAAAEGERYILGVAIETPDEAVRAQLGLPEDRGVIVMNVSPDSAAEEAGLKANDILVELGGEPIVGARELAEQVQENGGEPVDLTLLRDGEEMTVEVTPEKRPAPPIPPDAPQPPGNMRFFGPGVMIDPETGNVLRPGPGARPEAFRNFTIPGPSNPEMQDQLDEILEQLKQLREELDALKQDRPAPPRIDPPSPPGRRDRRDEPSDRDGA